MAVFALSQTRTMLFCFLLLVLPTQISTLSLHPFPPLQNDVNWIPIASPSPENIPKATGPFVATPSQPSETLPVFPLGSTPYIPGTFPSLSIFEPRYRKMYDAILISGGRRFLVPISHPMNDQLKTAKCSQYCVVFYLTELNDVSEKSNDQVKYLVDHVAIGIAKISHFTNPEVWKTRDTYLQAGYEVVEWNEELIQKDVEGKGNETMR